MKRNQAIEDLSEGIKSLHSLLGRLVGGDENETSCAIPILKGVPLDDYLPKSPWPDFRGRNRDCVTTEDVVQYIQSWALPSLISALDEVKNGK